MGDWDSDDAATGERSYKSSSRSNALKSSILKNSLTKKSQISDDDDDNYNSGRMSNRNRYDSPLNSNRSDAAYGKPPSGRLPTLSSRDSKGDYGSSALKNDYGSTKKSNGYDNTSSIGNYNDPFKSRSNLPAITYTPASKRDTNGNDSDDSITDRHNKFSKKNTTSSYESTEKKYDRFYDGKSESKYDKSSKVDKFDSKYDSKYDSKFETKYDTYDEDDLKKDSSSKFYRSDGTLKSTLTKKDDIDDYILKNNNVKSVRSNSLDRLTSAYNNILGNSTYPSASGKLQKFSSTSNINGIDNSSDRSYTMNSFNSTNLSVREVKNRSFLVGSLSAINGKGLLSNDELDRNFIDRKARVLISTWNMGGVKKLPENLDELVLPDTIQTLPDVYVIGAQEFDLNQKDWEISLQEQIGPTHVKISSYYHGSIGINVFLRRELIWYCSIVEFEHINLRAVNARPTKASIVISFQLFGTLMCFICSHFAAGEGCIDQRIDNYKTTITNIKLPKRLLSKNRALAADGTDNFDTVFWFGDFNFLINKERDKVEKKVSHLREKRGTHYEDIINHDELNQAMSQDKAFKNFLEGRITFEPTYKYDINTDTYDTSDKCRIPSYTDRILYRSRQKGNISCSYYDAIKEIKLSDHRPVFGLFEVNIRPGVDKVPLSYGDFDRQVYAAGYQKRKMFRAHDLGFTPETQVKPKKSPCVIQ